MASARTNFHIGDLLSVVTGVLLAPRGPSGVRALYEHLAGRPVSLEEVRTAGAHYRRYLLELYPELGTFIGPEVPLREFAMEWVERRAREFAEYFEVPAPPEDHPLRRAPDIVPPPGSEATFYLWPLGAIPYIVAPGEVIVGADRPSLIRPK